MAQNPGYVPQVRFENFNPIAAHDFLAFLKTQPEGFSGNRPQKRKWRSNEIELDSVGLPSSAFGVLGLILKVDCMTDFW